MSGRLGIIRGPKVKGTAERCQPYSGISKNFVGYCRAWVFNK
jgi:hypothetical protein